MGRECLAHLSVFSEPEAWRALASQALETEKALPLEGAAFDLSAFRKPFMYRMASSTKSREFFPPRRHRLLDSWHYPQPHQAHVWEL